MTPSTPAHPDQPDLIISARNVCTPEGIGPAEVHVSAGRITAVTRPAVRPVPPGKVFIELPDDEVLLPGLVDTHVHINEPGRTHWEGFTTATAAAAAGGVTTIIDMPLNSIPPTTDVAALEAKRRAADGQCQVDVGFWGGAVPGNERDRPGLHAAGVFGFKCFLVDSGVPEFPPLDDDGLAEAMRQLAGLGATLIVHAEDAACIASAPPASGGRYDQFMRSRPGAAEVAAVTRLVELARRTGARVHVLHLSSARAAPVIAAAQADGIAITAETCPHYLGLIAERVPDGRTEFKCCPPIRDQANQERLWSALRAGIVGCVVSDHSPCPPDLKKLDEGDFGTAWGGISSVQLGLPVVWTRARARGLGLADVVRWMATGPARLAGLAGKGAIAVGHDADLVAFVPEESFVVEPDRLLTRHRLTPYAGQQLYGVVRQTWSRGVPVWPVPPARQARPAGRLLTANR
jgi:allantoinase